MAVGERGNVLVPAYTFLFFLGFLIHIVGTVLMPNLFLAREVASMIHSFTLERGWLSF